MFRQYCAVGRSAVYDWAFVAHTHCLLVSIIALGSKMTLPQVSHV